MKLPIFCLLLVFCGAHGQFQVPVTEGEDLGTILANLQAQLNEQKSQLDDQKSEIDDMKQKEGAVYIRWGKTTCDNEALTETVYSGVAGGTKYDQSGGGTNYQCLPKDPQWGTYQDGTQGAKAYMYGSEYQIETYAPFGSTTLLQHDVPCGVCYVPTRGSKLMIPARNTCYSGWTEEYDGYLMASKHDHAGAKEYVCVDRQPEAAPGGYANENGANFYPVEARCGSLPCPNYVEGKELTCVVCTK